MTRLRFLWHDLAALWFVYQEARRRYPKFRRLELVRAAVELCVADQWDFVDFNGQVYAGQGGKLYCYDGHEWVGPLDKLPSDELLQ